MRSTLDLTVVSDKLFFGDCGHGIARYDEVRYPVFTTINDKMKSLYWNPKEVDLSQEKASFNKMTDAEQFVFTANLKRQILLDSIQGRAPSLAFLPHCTDSSLENCLLTWGFFESLHSESYTHVIRAIYPDPSVVFDDMVEIAPIVNCAADVSYYYDLLQRSPSKEALYLSLISANALEALRFFASFACTFSFGERGMVMGSATEIKFIARDEAQHLALVNHILKRLAKDDSDFVQIMQDLRPKAIEIFDQTAEQEKEWATYIFQHGPILGLNEGILQDYVEYLLPRRKAAAGLTTTTKFDKTNPIPWINKWLSDSDYQPAPQETEGTGYLTSAVLNNASDINFSFQL